MSPGRLVLVRHGLSTYNDQNRFTGWKDVPLNAQGIAEAEQAAPLAPSSGMASRSSAGESGCEDLEATEAALASAPTAVLRIRTGIHLRSERLQAPCRFLGCLRE